MKEEKRIYEHVRVAEKLRKDILTGRLEPGEKMKAERHLCDRFKASRITIRRALSTLEEERLVVRRHGSGTYLAESPARRIPLAIDFTDSVREHAPSLGRRLLLSRWDEAEGSIADALQLRAGEAILYAERVDSLDRRPVACDRVYIPETFADGLGKTELRHVDFVEVWTRACRFEIACCRQTVEAVAATAAVAGRLDLRREKPVLRATEVYIADGGQPAGMFVSHYDPDYICISSEQRWTVKAK